MYYFIVSLSYKIAPDPRAFLGGIDKTKIQGKWNASKQQITTIRICQSAAAKNSVQNKCT